MIPYIENMVKYFSNHDENMRTSATPVSGHLFKTISYAIVLEETRDKIHHYLFARHCLPPIEKDRTYTPK